MNRINTYDQLRAAIKGIIISAALLPATSMSTTQLDNQAGADTSLIAPLATTIYTREDILNSGFQQTADFIRHLPINYQGSFRSFTGSNSQGNAHVSVYGLGAQRTLILLDGQPVAKSAHSAAWTNLNQIPMAAIERIEVSGEGASAKYGSDAVAGVIHVITRSDFEGAELYLGGANPSIPEQGGEQAFGSLLLGTQSERSSLIAGVSWYNKEWVFQRDLPWSRPVSLAANDFTTLVNGFDDFNFTALGSACESFDPGFVLQDNSFSINGQRCVANRNDNNTNETSLDNKSFFIKANHAINNHWTIWSHASFSQSESAGLLPSAFSSSFTFNPLSVNSPNNPTNPNGAVYDPTLGLDPVNVNWWHQFRPLGQREISTNAQLSDVRAGIKGSFADWQLDAGIMNTENHADYIGRNFLLQDVALSLVESGSYSLADPSATSEQTLDAMRAMLVRDSRFNQQKVYFDAHLSYLVLPGGSIDWRLAASHTQHSHLDRFDPQWQSGQVDDVTPQINDYGKREVTSLGFSVALPVSQQTGVNLALRMDDYSDIGAVGSASLALHHWFNEQFQFSTSWNRSHRAPDLKEAQLSDLNLRCYAQNPFSQFDVCDQASQAVAAIVDQPVVNPQLKEESAEQFNIYVHYQPLENLGITLGYFDHQISDVISR